MNVLSDYNNVASEYEEMIDEIIESNVRIVRVITDGNLHIPMIFAELKKRGLKEGDLLLINPGTFTNQFV